MIKFNALLFLLSLTIFISCDDKPINSNSSDIISNPEYGSLQDSENPPFSFELVEEIPLNIPEDFILSGISYLTNDPEGNFYFFDYRQNKLISVDSDGKTRWITGEKGRGPGDFENVSSLIYSRQGILIGNLSGARFDLFSFDGNFIKSYDSGKDASFGRILGTSNDSSLIIAKEKFGKIGSDIFVIDIISDTLKIRNRFEIDVSGEFDMPRGMAVGYAIHTSQNKVITGSPLDYTLQVHNLEGELEFKVTRDFDKIVPPGVYSTPNTSSMRTFGGLVNIYNYSDNYFIVNVMWPTNVMNPNDYVGPNRNTSLPEPIFNNALDFYDKNWNFLYSIEGESLSTTIGYIQKIDDSDFLFTTQTDPIPTIKKYALRTPDN